MGKSFSKLFDKWFGLQDMRVVMLGLDAAGKTTVLYKLHIGEVLSTVPTIGFNVEKVQYKKVQFTVWDVGGQEKLRPLWRHYFNNTDGLIYVVDSLDKDRIGKAQAEFKDSISPCVHQPVERTLLVKSSASVMCECGVDRRRQQIIEDPLMRNSVILVMANKQDLPGALTPAEVCEALDLHSLKSRKWHVQGTVATAGEGLYEGLDWLSSTLQSIHRVGGTTSVGGRV